MKVARNKLLVKAVHSSLTVLSCSVGAFALIQSAEASSPGQLQYDRGLACWRRGQVHDAISFFSSAIQTQPTLAAAYESRAACYLQLEKFEEALPDVNKAIALSPKMASAYADRAKIHNEHGNSQLALLDFTKAIDFSKDKPNYTYYQNRGALYKESGADDKAISDFTAAIKLQPEDIWIHYFRACIYFKQGKYKEALADTSVSIATRSKGEKGKFYQLRASCYEKLGQPLLAKKDRDTARADADFGWGSP